MTDEQLTFAGIPIPLTMECLLDAMVMADRRKIVPSYLQGQFPNAQRQYRAFRERILRMDAEKDLEIKKLNLINDINLGLYEDIEFDANAKKISIAAYKAIVEQQSKQLAAKDAENQRLREALGVYANHDNWDIAGLWSEPIIWNWTDKGYGLAEKTLKELSNEDNTRND